ncbi:MAG: MoxR family ATPase [Ardenticatenaceae bacterium]|nr:MoxR family ATPase [Ardenticatenaceae bacterium]
MSDKVYEYEYTGDFQDEERPYLPTDAVKEAVDLAILLGRPLLLKGEPGCGKTRLAEAVAYELARRNGVEAWPFEFWPVKSTSRARDGLYTFDAIGRLRDAQMAAVRYQETKVFEEPPIKNYVQYGPLGKAIKDNATQRTLVLIDEIDKADIDFPNDLLIELDELRFTVDELPERDGVERAFKAQAKPIVLITSNDEKELPDAFLRRCVFLYIEVPPDELLLQILIAHCLPKMADEEAVMLLATAVAFLKALQNNVEAQPPGGDAELLARTLHRFLQLRQQLINQKGDAGKRVSTSELIDWFKVLYHQREKGVAVLDKLQEDVLPYLSVLLKNRDDYRLV